MTVIVIQILSTDVFFHIRITALSINTPTTVRIAPNAFCTISNSAKLFKNAAINVTMTIEGNITPAVAAIPPKTPFLLYPINVAVFTAMTPGVHCPIAK